jgi:4-hydroxy-3-methylbut-2-enyl diphosphate reductase
MAENISPMKVIVSKISGFCSGVRRAISLVYDAGSRCAGKVYVDGELVHSKQVMEDLENAGVELFVGDNFARITPLDCIVTRAHGISESRYAQLSGCFKNVIDGTCPHVARVFGLVKRVSNSGRSVVIMGDRRHPEVLALASAAESGKCFVINSREEISSLPRSLSNVLVISQSTICEEFFNDLATGIVKIFPDAEIKNTICSEIIHTPTKPCLLRISHRLPRT